MRRAPAIAGLLPIAAIALAQTPDVPREAGPEADLAKALAYAAQARWDEAVAGLQALLERPGPVEGVVPQEAPFALGWREAARRALVALPAEGRAAYQKLIGGAPAEALAAAKASGERKALHDLVRRWPASDEAWEARRLLAAEGAPPREAIDALEVLLDHAPPPARDVAGTALRIADLSAQVGEVGRILLLARRAKKEWPQVSALVEGKEVGLEDALRSRAESAKTVARTDWPRWGGGLDGAGLLPEVRRISRFLWSQEVNEGKEAARGGLVGGDQGGGPGPASDPVVAGGRIYLVAGDTLLCRDLARGNHVWDFRVQLGSLARGGPVWRQGTDRSSWPRPSPPCVDGGLVAFEYGRAAVGRDEAPTTIPSGLHVIDAANGKELWSWGVDKDATLKGKTTLGGPILAPEGLFTLATSAGPGGRTATLLGFDRERGDAGPRWRRRLATDPSPDAFQREPDAVLAWADGTVYAATNAGVLAAVDAASGDLQWTWTYADPASGWKETELANTPGMRTDDPPASWVIAADGAVIFGAADTAHVGAISPQTGRRLWDVASPRDTLPAGYGGGRLYLSGSKANVFDLATGKRCWVEVPGRSARAAAAANGCLCWGNHALSLRGGARGAELDRYEWQLPQDRDPDEWPEPDGAILALGDRVLLQARGRLYCFRLEDPAPPEEDLPKKLAEWIVQLASPRYADRQRAAESLLAAGPAAEERLKEAAMSADREVSWRADEVLRALSLSGLFRRVEPKDK